MDVVSLLKNVRTTCVLNAGSFFCLVIMLDNSYASTFFIFLILAYKKLL